MAEKKKKQKKVQWKKGKLKNTKPRKCAICKEIFTPNDFSGIVCSEECKAEHKIRSSKGMPKDLKKKKLKAPKVCPWCGRKFNYLNSYTQHINATMRRIQEGKPGCVNFEKSIHDIKEQRLVERKCCICNKRFVTELNFFREIAFERKETFAERLERIRKREVQVKPFCSEECKELFLSKYNRKEYMAHYEEEDAIMSTSAKDSGSMLKKTDGASLRFKKSSTILIF